eukprot:106908-Pelagomonas_calceolata.AAC.8
MQQGSKQSRPYGRPFFFICNLSRTAHMQLLLHSKVSRHAEWVQERARDRCTWDNKCKQGAGTDKTESKRRCSLPIMTSFCDDKQHR